MDEWTALYENDTYPDGEGGSTFGEWWNITDGKRTFRADYKEDAKMLLAALNGLKDAERYRKLVASGKFCAAGSGAGWGLVCGVGRADKAELDAAADALPAVGAA